MYGVEKKGVILSGLPGNLQAIPVIGLPGLDDDLYYKHLALKASEVVYSRRSARL